MTILLCKFCMIIFHFCNCEPVYNKKHVIMLYMQVKVHFLLNFFRHPKSPRSITSIHHLDNYHHG